MRIRLAAAVLLSVSSTFAVADNAVHHHTVQRNVRHKATHTTAARSSHATAGIDSERATQIQTALIKQGYLTGEPTGSWDSRTVAAMQKMQSDNGWQTKMTPDARALNKLGLGAQPLTDTPAPPQ